MKTYYVEMFAFNGESSSGVCTCESKDFAMLIGKTLDKGGIFSGPELLTGEVVDWRLRILECDTDSDCEVIWEGKN